MNIQDRIVAAIKEEPIIAKHIYQDHWTSGSSTIVYPITLWAHNVVIQIDTKRDYFQKAIERVLNKHKDLFCDGWFCKNDNSCPAEIRFRYSNEVDDEINHRKYETTEATTELVEAIFNN